MSASSSSSSSSAPLGVVVCGGGRIGTVHLTSLVAEPRKYTVLYTVDVVLERAQQMAHAAGDQCKALTHYAEALADPRVEAVIICSPTATHMELIEKSVQVGKHIFCEKPVSMRAHEVDYCFGLAEAKGVRLFCAYQRRADESFSKLQRTVASGKIGTVQIVKSTSRDHPKPTMEFLKISGGIFHDCGSHDIDLCRWIAGTDPVEVYANGHAFDPTIGALDDFDTISISLKFPNGVLGLIDISRLAMYGYDQRLEVHGDKGMVQTENRPTTSCVISTSDGISSDNPLFSFPQRYRQAYATEMGHFYNCVRDPTASTNVSREDCVRVAQIADAAEHAAKTRTVVNMADWYKRPTETEENNKRPRED